MHPLSRSFLAWIAVPLMFTPPLSRTVSEVRPVSPSLAVWWDREYLNELRSPSDCESASRTWRPVGTSAGEFYTVEMTMPDGTMRECKTVAEWCAAGSQGGYAYSTLAVDRESHFIERSLAYSVIPHLLPATRSGFAAEQWSTDARHLIQVDDHCSEGKRYKREAVEWEFKPNQAAYQDVDDFEWARVLARGDYDGDGSQDLVVSSGAGRMQGTMRGYDGSLFTRRPSGRVVDISARLLLGTCSASQIRRLRSDLATSFGLPERVPIQLSGQMAIGERALNIEAEIVFVDGFVTGTYQYSKIGTPIPIEGTLGVRKSIALAEYALDDQPNGWFDFTWKREGGDLVLEGMWCEAIESHHVKLTGTLPKQAAKAVLVQ